MKAFIVNDGFIREIIRGSTIDEKAKYIFQESVIKDNQTLSQFVFDVFSYYMPAYEQAELQTNPYDYANHIKEAFGPLIRKFESNPDTSIRIIDPFDALYNRSFPGIDTTLDSHILDVVYSSIEEMFGQDEAQTWFQEVMQLIEYVVITLELSFINVSKRDSDQAFKLFFSYAGNHLTIFVH